MQARAGFTTAKCNSLRPLPLSPTIGALRVFLCLPPDHHFGRPGGGRAFLRVCLFLPPPQKQTDAFLGCAFRYLSIYLSPQTAPTERQRPSRARRALDQVQRAAFQLRSLALRRPPVVTVAHLTRPLSQPPRR